MADQDVNLKTDVALIKKDIKQIERFFAKFDLALASMTEIAQKVAVQGEILKNTEEKIDTLEQRMVDHKEEDIRRNQELNRKLEEHRAAAYRDHDKVAKESAANRKERNEEILSQLNATQKIVENRLTKFDERVKVLEQWKWYIGGVGAAIVIVVGNSHWGSIIGG